MNSYNLIRQTTRLVPWWEPEPSENETKARAQKASGLFCVHLKDSTMRYLVRWSNGYWKTFDTVKFDDVAVHGLERDAREAVKRLNSRHS
jgi:hypothetical protein